MGCTGHWSVYYRAYGVLDPGTSEFDPDDTFMKTEKSQFIRSHMGSDSHHARIVRAFQ